MGKTNYAAKITMVKKKGLLKKLYWAKTNNGNLLKLEALPCEAENLVVLAEKVVMMQCSGYEYGMYVGLDGIMSKIPQEVAEKTVGLSIKTTRPPKSERKIWSEKSGDDAFAVKVTAYGLEEGATKPPIAEYARIANNDLKTIER